MNYNTKIKIFLNTLFLVIYIFILKYFLILKLIPKGKLFRHN